MNKLRETKSYIKLSLNFIVSLEKGSLIDFETIGIPRKDKEYEIVTLGYFYKNKAVVIQRKAKDKERFYRELRKEIKKLKKPFYSYNSKFEKDVMELELKIKTKEEDFFDLMYPWRNLAEEIGTKWPKLEEIMNEWKSYMGEEEITGKDVPGIWKAYVSGGSENLLKMIMNHCLNDVLREILLLFRYNIIKSKVSLSHF